MYNITLIEKESWLAVWPSLLSLKIRWKIYGSRALLLLMVTIGIKTFFLQDSFLNSILGITLGDEDLFEVVAGCSSSEHNLIKQNKKSKYMAFVWVQFFNDLWDKLTNPNPSKSKCRFWYLRSSGLELLSSF